MAFNHLSIRNLMLFGLLILSGVDDISGTTGSTLKAVSMLFRHGDRSPTMSYPLDPYHDYPWPGGYGALSPRGFNELFGSGLIKSTRYSSLLSINCDTDATCTMDLDKILVLSSAIQRCVDSVQSFLNGFVRVDWPSSLVNVIPQDQDEMLAAPGKPCPKYEDIITTGVGFDEPEFKTIIDFESTEGQELLDYLQNNTGLTMDSPIILLLLEDTLLIEKDNNLQLPAWTDSVFEQYLVPLTSAFFDISGSSEYTKIRSSALFRDMTTRLDNLIAGSDDQNILLYSAHDATVAGMLHFLEVRDQTVARPTYAASINVELHENQDIVDDYEVKLIYFASYDDQNPIEIDIPDCQAPCPYKLFKSNIQPRLTPDYETACSQ
ncbi:unnamed protein product [Hermetia illucens]|uniref:acid phosphatase n=1 Tax=Hermetia illucens TaxID=343691 RepID=A0A7R8UQ18_HERIL|nr:lysosomal acid phosphatase-like [Hermetia illucens]CAD7084864.1 unnamed protein product [Hermetia illucens]